MNVDQEREFRRRLIALIGKLDAKQQMDREAIDDTIDELLAAARAAGWNPPTPNSRR